MTTLVSEKATLIVGGRLNGTYITTDEIDVPVTIGVVYNLNGEEYVCTRAVDGDIILVSCHNGVEERILQHLSYI